MKLSGIPIFTFIVSLTHAIEWITYRSIYNITFRKFGSQPSAVIARVLNKKNKLKTIDNSQSTNVAKTLKIFSVYSSLGL